MSTTAPRPLALTDAQYSAIYQAVQPLAPADRSRFLGELAALLRAEPVIGDGSVAKAVRFLMPRFFRPPTGTAGPSPHRNNTGPAIE